MGLCVTARFVSGTECVIGRTVSGAVCERAAVIGAVCDSAIFDCGCL